MPTGDLKLQITMLSGEPLSGDVRIDLEPMSGEPGTGGESMELSVALDSHTNVTVTGITCRGGPGTMYQVEVSARHFRSYSFFQSIKEKVVNTASDNVEFWVKPGDVKDISAPGFSQLPVRLRGILDNAKLLAVVDEDKDLLGASSESLYQKLGALRKACVLNIAKKASHATADNCIRFFGGLLLCRQDRFFAIVDPSLPEKLRRSASYKSAPETLHEPLPDFELAEGSFKTRDPHANLQVTFMRNTKTGDLAADIDIDESAGIEHGFEVIRNALFQKRTNPYLIREFMLAADLEERTLDPGYGFVF